MMRRAHICKFLYIVLNSTAHATPNTLGFSYSGDAFFFNAPAVRRPAVCAARPHLSMEPLATKPWVMAPQCATARLGRNTPLAPWCRVERWWGPQHGSRDITRPQNLVCEHWITNNSYYIYSMCIYIYICVCVYIYICDSNILNF